ncbi:hypothetical protein BH10ACI2_BH10ACI2_17180 [soil metagenome]
MTPERWQQIEEIFHEALDLNEAVRSDFIKEKAGKDNDLIAEVEKLLSQFDDASSFIEQPLYDSAKSGVLSALLDESGYDPLVGKLLGNYRIEREVGRGGMGAVYEALRADGEFRLRVALKVVKRGVDTDFVLKRFRNERQILAALDHPFITRLIDGGTTDDGRPYFVMEFIDGLPLYRYCDKNRLSIRERLVLFCRVTEAVEYAHHRLVIHRDLKPSNIFIANDGSPRLLDFGIAKLLDPELASYTLQPTATARRMMTVDYASPEQVRGEKVTYATDVYSLGVILFELLTGHRPYKLTSRSPHDVARAICDDEPYLPSIAASGSDNDLPVVRVNPSAPTLPGDVNLGRESKAQLADQLRGNLDNIILKALRKDQNERHESVAALRENIERHLKGETIPTEFELPKPVVRRESVDANSKLVAVLPLSIMSPTGMENTDEAYLTIGLADAIITRLASVRKLTVRPTSSITGYSGPDINPFRAGQELGVDFVLDGRIRRFGERLRISLQLLDVKAGSAIWAGQFDELLTDVLELEDAISGQVAAALIPQLTGEDRQKLAKRGTNNPQAYEAYLKGRFHWNQFTAASLPKAIECFEEAIRLDPNYALAYVGVADFYVWANIYGLIPVAQSYERATAAGERALKLDDQLGEAYATMGLIINNRYGREPAEKMLLRAIDLAPNYPLAHEWYSAMLVGSGRFAEGVESIRRAEQLDPLSLRTKTLVSWTYYQAGDFEAALAKAQQIVSFDDTNFQGHLRLGYVLCELGRGAEAVAAIEKGMELAPNSAMNQFHYCFALAAAGRIDDARKVLNEMLAAAATGYVKPMFLGFACVAVGDLDEAFKYLDISVDEMDPWVVWLATDPKLGLIRDDPRYLDLLRRSKNPLVSNKDRIDRITDPNAQISSGHGDGHTISASEMPTLEYRSSVVKRHYGKMAAAAVALIALIGAYSTGILTFSFNSGPRPDAQNPLTAKRSIAVLPFENATGDPANDYIADGMSESLINRMANISDLRTISRAAAFSYRSKQMQPEAIGKELGVDNVLVGTVTKKDDEYTVKTELVRVEDGKRLFSMFFVEKSDHIVSLQGVMVSRVIETLDLQTTGKTVVGQKSYTENNQAFEHYLKGEFHRQKGTPADSKASIDDYENALKLDPNYALAYQGLSLAYRSGPAYGFLFPQEAYPKAKAAAEKALALDPSLATAYVSLASVKSTFDWDFAGAEQEYRRAIQLGPNNSEAHYSFGNFLVAMGRTEEALTEYRIAQQIDPLSLNMPTNVGWAMYISGRYDDAIVEIRKVIARDPSFARAYMSLGEILEEQGKYDEAITSLQKARDLSNDPLAEMALAHTYASAGRRTEALKIAVELEDKVRQKTVSPFLPAVVYAGLNDKDKSFYWLERAYQERSNWLTLIKVGRRLKNLHGDPRFDDLLKRVGFEVRRL